MVDDEREEAGLAVAFFPETERVTADGFTTNLLVALPVDGSPDLAAAVGESRRADAELRDAVTVFERAIELNDGVRGHLRGVTYSQGEDDLYGIQLLVVDDGRFFSVLVTTAEATWSDHEQEFNAAFAQLRDRSLSVSPARLATRFPARPPGGPRPAELRGYPGPRTTAPTTAPSASTPPARDGGAGPGTPQPIDAAAPTQETHTWRPRTT